MKDIPGADQYVLKFKKEKNEDGDILYAAQRFAVKNKIVSRRDPTTLFYIERDYATRSSWSVRLLGSLGDRVLDHDDVIATATFLEKLKSGI